MLNCYLCGSEYANLSGLNAHFRALHREEFENVGWDKIKLKLIGRKEAKKEEAVEEVQKEDYGKGVEEKGEAPAEVEVAFDEESGREISPTKLTHRLRLDPRINVLYSFLKTQDKIPTNWTIGDFINAYVMGHVKVKDGLDLSVLQTITGDRDMKIAMLEPKGSEDKGGKIDPDEELKDIDRTMARQLKMKTYEKLLGKTKSEGEGGGLEKVVESAMAFKVINQVFGEEGGNKSNREVAELKEKLAKMEEDKKITELKAEISRLVETVKTQRPSSEFTGKDLVNLQKEQWDAMSNLKEAIHQKDSELQRQSLSHLEKTLTDKMDRIEGRPRFTDQIKEIQDTAQALEKTGFLKKGSEKSSVEIISELVGGVAEKVTGSPGFQEWMANQGRKEPQYTPQQLAQLEAAQRAQRAAQQPNTQPVMPTPGQGPLALAGGNTTEEEKNIYDNLINISDQGDRRRRQE